MGPYTHGLPGPVKQPRRYFNECSTKVWTVAKDAIWPLGGGLVPPALDMVVSVTVSLSTLGVSSTQRSGTKNYTKSGAAVPWAGSSVHRESYGPLLLNHSLFDAVLCPPSDQAALPALPALGGSEYGHSFIETYNSPRTSS